MTSAQTAQTVSSQGVLKWAGSNFFKYNKQFGTITFLNGEIINSNDVVIGGDYQINMTSLVNSEGELNKNLGVHLKTEATFDNKKNTPPELKFIEMTTKSISTIAVKALLIIEGVPNKIDFVLQLDSDDDNQFFKSEFSINEPPLKSVINPKTSQKDVTRGCPKPIHFKVKVAGMTGDQC